MKILMISTDQKIFEPGSEVKSRMNGYASQADELFIVILGITRDLKIEGKLKYIGMTRWRALFWHPVGEFDLVTSQDPFETGIIAWRLARRLQAELELQIHTDIGSPYFWQESIKNKIRYLIAKFLLPHADRVRVVSEKIRHYLVDKLKIANSKIVVKPIAVDIEKIKNAPITVNLHQKYPQFEKIILMASRLTREKNISLAIDAMCEVIKQKPKTGLVIVGSGPEEKKLKKLSITYNLAPNVVFEPWIDQETLFSYYKTCDLFLLTSLYEGYGLTLVEAQAAGCRIISTDVGVAREMGTVIVDYSLSLVVPVILEKLK